jgi:hypothetical protein
MNERSSQPSAGETQQEKQNSPRLRFAANRSIGAPADPPSQGHQYTGRDHWDGADFNFSPNPKIGPEGRRVAAQI